MDFKLNRLSRRRTFGIHCLGFLGALLVALVLHPPLPGAIAQESTFEIKQWQFNPRTQILTVPIPPSIVPTYFTLDDPPRMIIDVPNSRWTKPTQTKSYSGIVSQVRIGQFQEDVTRFVLNWTGTKPLQEHRFKLFSSKQADGLVRWQFGHNQDTSPIQGSGAIYPPALLPPPLPASDIDIPPPPEL